MEAPRVAVCIATFRRPEGLRRLLSELQEQTFHGEPPAVDVVVVDNDEARSAQAVCRDSPLARLHYVHEPRRGIPQARNRAIKTARELGCGLIAFIDDDELPANDWLDQLLSA